MPSINPLGILHSGVPPLCFFFPSKILGKSEHKGFMKE